jgi:hypothetical protein
MDVNPYEAPLPNPSERDTTILQQVAHTLKSLMLYLSWLAIVGISGTVGLAVGFVLWSQFFWSNERPIAFLSPTGFNLTLITGLGFALSAGIASIALWRRWFNPQI